MRQVEPSLRQRRHGRGAERGRTDRVGPEDSGRIVGPQPSGQGGAREVRKPPVVKKREVVGFAHRLSCGATGREGYRKRTLNSLSPARESMRQRPVARLTRE